MLSLTLLILRSVKTSLPLIVRKHLNRSTTALLLLVTTLRLLLTLMLAMLDILDTESVKQRLNP